MEGSTRTGTSTCAWEKKTMKFQFCFHTEWLYNSLKHLRSSISGFFESDDQAEIL